MIEFKVKNHVPDKVLKAFENQTPDQNVQFVCKNDTEHCCTEWILEYSSFFGTYVTECNVDEDPISLEYKDFNLDTIQAYLSHMHGKPSGKVEVGLCVDLLNFLSFEQKTDEPGFDKEFFDMVQEQLLNADLQLDVKLMVCIGCEKLDMRDKPYQPNLVDSIFIKKLFANHTLNDVILSGQKMDSKSDRIRPLLELILPEPINKMVDSKIADEIAIKANRFIKKLEKLYEEGKIDKSLTPQAVKIITLKPFGPKVTVSRFSGTVKTWMCDNSIHAIDFKADEAKFVAGFGLFGRANDVNCTAKIELKHKSSKHVLASAERTLYGNQSIPVRAFFDQPIQIAALEFYTATCQIIDCSETVYYGTGARECGGFTFALNEEFGGTDVHEGQIPDIIYYDAKEVTE